MRRKALWGLLLILILILAGVIVWYASRPRAVVSNAFASLNDLESAAFTAETDISNTAADAAGTFNIALDGRFDRGVDGRPSVAADIAVTAEAQGSTIEGSGQARLIGDNTYFIVEQVPAELPQLAQVRGQWFMLDRGGAGEAAATNGGQEIFTSARMTGIDVIARTPVVKYRVEATPAAVTRFLNGVAQVLGTDFTQTQAESIAESVRQLSSLPVDVWVVPGSNNLKQLRADLATPDGTTRFTLAIADRNPTVNITPPEDARPLGGNPSPEPSPAP